MSRKPIENGARPGKLVSLGPGGKDHKGRYTCECLCDCGRTKTVPEVYLRHGVTSSCGCLVQETSSRVGRAKGDRVLPGEVFGRLTTVESRGYDSARKQIWLAKCECGAQTVVRVNNLRTGTTTSCGCFSRETVARRNTKHGLGALPEAQVWRDIKKRCLNPLDPSYPIYGGRGISVSPEWVGNFPQFLADVGRKPTKGATLDRIDNNRGCEPGNTRWTTMQAQQRNKRTNVVITAFNHSKTAIEWSEELGIPSQTLINRYRRAQALELPLEEVLKCPTTPDAFKKLQTKYGHPPY